MDDEHKSLESTLEQLQAAKVPDGLESRIFAIFEGGSDSGAATAGADVVVPFPMWQRIGSVAALLIAGVGVFFAVLNNIGPAGGSRSGDAGDPNFASTPAPAGDNTFVPVSAENVFEGVRDRGVYLSPEGKPVRELLYQFSDSFRWENPDDGSTMEMTVPRQRTFYVPVVTD